MDWPESCASARFAAATFYFFGELTIEVRNRLLHIDSLTFASGYVDFARVGFHPLFAYFILFLPLMIPVIYGLMLIRNPDGPDKSLRESQGGVADARSAVGVPKIKQGKLRWAPVWELFKRNQLKWVIFLVLLIEALFQLRIFQALQPNFDLIVKPASANFQVFGPAVTIEWFTFWGWVCGWVAFLTPIALGLAYFEERDRALYMQGFPKTQLKTGIALTLFAALISLLYYSAEFRGFLAAREAPELSISQTDLPELTGKRVFLLGQNDSSYALLTSRQPEDTRTIVLVRKDELPVIVLGASVPVLQPIQSTQ